MIVLVLAACGDNFEGLDLSEYDRAWHDARCRRLVTCGVMPDLGTCERTNPGPIATSLTFRALVANGAVQWDPEVALACIQQLEGRGCEWVDTSSSILACWAMHRGMGSDGEACVYGFECKSRECRTEGCVDACCTGTCVGDEIPLPALLGESCSFAPCRQGICLDEICVPHRREGESCEWFQCAPGLKCIGHSGVKRCEALPDTGERCLFPETSETCRRIRDLCGPDLRCRPGVVGAECEEDDQCLFYLRCDLMTHRCAPNARTIGDECFYDVDCSDLGSFCDEETQRCAWPRANAEPCTDDRGCASNLCDHDGVCAENDVCL